MNPLKARLAAGELICAAWCELGSPDVAEIMVHHGWPVIVIDGEHGLGEIETWLAVARAVEAAGGQVVLRVPDGNPTLLKRVLDRGFRSILVPLVSTAEEARAIVAACRYPDRGRRGYCAPIVRASHWGARPGYAREEAHEELLLMVQCEDATALDNLAEIARIEGIDAIFTGPNDLAGALGYLERMGEPVPQAAFRQVETTCAEAGMPLATITGAIGDWSALRARGYRLVVGPNDVSFLAQGARAAARERDAALAPGDADSADTGPAPRY